MKLSVRALSFGYPSQCIGHDVDLDLFSGEILCLLGPNGSGKTTLFKTILGLLKKQGGTISLDGEPLSGWSRRQLAQAMAYVPQASAGYFPYTVMDTVLMGRTARIGLFATPSQRDRAIAASALARVRLADFANAIFTRLSGGQRQLVLIARALAQEPKILVMDEPTASLDFGNQVLVLSHIKELARQGIGIILSSHDPDHAFACADRVALLHEGSLLACGSPQKVVTRENLQRLYKVEVEIVSLPGTQRNICVPKLDY